MSVTVHNWNKRGICAEIMVQNNFCYFELSDGNKKIFHKSMPGPTATEAANELNEQLDAIIEGVVIVTMFPDAKKKTIFKEYQFKVKETPSISGFNPDYIAEKLEAALFRQKVELYQQHEKEKNQLIEKINGLNNEMNESFLDRVGKELFKSPAIQNKVLNMIDKFTGEQPKAAIHGVNEDMERIYKFIPEYKFNEFMKILADNLETDSFATLSKLNQVFNGE